MSTNKTSNNRPASIAPKTRMSAKSSADAKDLDYWHFIPIIFIASYLFVDFVPEWGGIDVMGSQWVFLVIVNLLSTGYIYCFSKEHGYEVILKKLFSQFMCRAYVAFLILAGVSVFFAINRVEAIMCYTSVIITVIAFLNMAVLLTGRILSFRIIAHVISIILLIQAVQTLRTFFAGMDTNQLVSLIYGIKGNTGNKNIFAASIAVKLSFVMYCVYNLKGWWLRSVYSITLILGALALFFVNARSAYLGLILETTIFSVFVLLQFLKHRRWKETLVQYVPIILSFCIAFFIAQTTLIYAEKLPVNEADGLHMSVTERLKSLTVKSNNITRIKLWLGGLDFMQKHPIMGAGIGNCKLAIIPYEKEFIRDFQFAKHLHQDFIQIGMELGVPGFLLFISLFFCALIYVVKVWRSNMSDQIKTIAAFSLIALVGYTIDALFNFPAERPIMQVLFALILAVNVSALLSEFKITTIKPTAIRFTTIFFGISLIFLIVAAYCKYVSYQSLVAQRLTISDFPNQATHHSAEVESQLADIPNLDANNIPIGVIKAWYLLNEKKYDEAIALLNKTAKVNPYNMANEFVKVQVFHRADRPDSAWYYAHKSFNTRPNNIAIYSLFNSLCLQRKDTLSIHQAFKECIKFRNEPAVWNEYMATLTNLRYNETKLFAILDSAAKQFPMNASILERNYMTKADLAYVGGRIDTALTYFSKLNHLSPSNNAYVENIGLCYYVLRKYDLAIPYFDKLIATNVYANGRSEYFKGMCLTYLGRKEQACFFLKIADSKDFPFAKNAVATYCK